MSGGVFTHFDMGLAVDLDIYATIEGDGYTAVEIAEKRDAICKERACNLPLLVRGYRKIFPTPKAMGSILGQGHLKLSRDKKILKTDKSERGQARERKPLTAASAPGCSWVHHARSDYNWQCSHRHQENNGLKPSDYQGFEAGKLAASLTSTFDAATCRKDPLDSHLAIAYGIDPSSAFRADLDKMSINQKYF